MCTCAALLFILAYACAAVLAGQRGATPSRSKPNTKAEQKARQSDASTRHRKQAIALLIETADAASSFDDLLYSARIQALVADALWPFDELTARAVFQRAWKAATAADKAEQEVIEDETGTPAAVITEARDEVLTKASRRPSIAEAFLREMLSTDEKREEKSATTEQPSRAPWREVSAGGMRRISLAHDLLNSGEHLRAAEIVAPVAQEGVSADLITFMLCLREQSPNIADKLFLHLLGRMKAHIEEADANDVLLLSSYVLSPQLLAVVDERGALQFRSVARLGAAASAESTPMMPEARAAFYDFAAAVLLRRKLLPTANSVSANAYYFAIERLLPFFEREAAQYAPNLRAEHAALSHEIQAPHRDRLSAQRELHNLTPERAGDPLRSQMENLQQARNTAERDRLRTAIVKTAARHKLWDRAHRIAVEIEDTEAQHAALSFIAVSQIASISHAYPEDDTIDFERAAKFIRGADVPPLARAWGFAQAALMAAHRNKKERALELINEAAHEAERTERGTNQRIAAFITVAKASARTDAARAWELLREVVQAVNAVEDFAGDETSLDLAINTSSGENEDTEFSITDESFRLDGIFATMAALDFERALIEARALTGKIPRAFASIAIARVALEKNSRH